MGNNSAGGRRGTVRAKSLPRYIHGSTAPDPARVPEPVPECPRCTTGLFPVELADREGHKAHALHCVLCGTYIEPGHVPDTEVVRTVRGPRGPRK